MSIMEVSDAYDLNVKTAVEFKHHIDSGINPYPVEPGYTLPLQIV